jgi:dimethylglycine dehydrogenase
VRERVGLLDLGGFTKLEVAGEDADRFLDRLICGRLPRIGRVALAYMCQPDGGLLSELTIARLAADRFYLCSAATAEWHDRHWLLTQRRAEEDVAVHDLSARYGTLVLAGPEARTVLGGVTDADLSNAAFPWLAAQPIEIGCARLLALRINYVGELGWELHVPFEAALPVYHALMEAGSGLGIRDFGMYAMDSLRLEKGYPAWRVDLSHEYTPLDAALERFVDFGKDDFVGRDALLRQRVAGATQRLVPLLVETEVEAPFCASVFDGEERVGIVGSAGYGHTLQHSIALAYVLADRALPGRALEVGIYGERRKAAVGRAPLYDPENLRLRA